MEDTPSSSGAASSLSTAYKLKKLEAPRLAGWALKSFVTVAAYSDLLISKIMKDSNLFILRDVHLHLPMTVHPIGPVIAPSSSEASANASSSVAPLPSPPKDLNAFHFPSVEDYAAAYKSGKTTPSIVTRCALDAARTSESDAGDLSIRPFICLDETEALKAASESDRRIKEGRPRSLLEGIPVAIKDEMDVKGLPTSAGTCFLGKCGPPAAEDCTVVARLREAGAIIIGKTRMHEIGIGVTGLCLSAGTSRNPYNPNHFTGGSSSGSAAAVASGCVPLAIGADGGGSIRIPSAFCGLPGLKPSFGRVSEFGAIPLCESVGHIGPMTTCLKDAALAYEIIAGPDAKDLHSQAQPPMIPSSFAVSNDLTGIRIGIYDVYFNDCSEEVRKICRATIDGLVSRGAIIVPIEIPYIEEMRVAHLATITSEMSTAMNKYEESRVQQNHDCSTLLGLRVGQMWTAIDFIASQRVRTLAMNLFRDLYEKSVDVIAFPTTGVTAPFIKPDVFSYGEEDVRMVSNIMQYSFIANLTGLPSCQVPCGFDSGSLPVGIQFMASWWREDLCMRVSSVVEEMVAKRPPKVFYNVLQNAIRDSEMAAAAAAADVGPSSLASIAVTAAASFSALHSSMTPAALNVPAEEAEVVQRVSPRSMEQEHDAAERLIAQELEKSDSRHE